MSPFAAGTWSVVGNIGGQGGAKSPFNLAYSPDRDILIAGQSGSGAIFSWETGALLRSVDKGQTWTVVRDFLANPGPDGGNEAPVAVALLRDPTSGLERFVAVVVRIAFTGTSPESSRVRMWWSDTGLTWTPGTLLVDAPGSGAAVTGAGCTSVATRPRGGLSEPALEHFVAAVAVRDAVTARGVFKSTDLGLTWTLVGDTAPITHINGGANITALVAMPDRHLLLGGVVIGGGTGHSTDGAQSWQSASPTFDPDFLLAFDPGTIVGVRRGTLTGPAVTRICCNDAASWPPGNTGPTFGLSGAVVTLPVIINLGKWEVIMAAGGFPLGTVELVYSDNGGETEAQRASIDTGSGIISHLSGGVMLNDGRPLIVVGVTGHVFRSSDVRAGIFGQRIYCVTAPAPGVGFPGFPPPCRDFYNPCPQLCPVDPLQPAGQLLPIPVPVTLGAVFPLGAVEIGYGEPIAAIYGGQPNTLIPVPVLGLPAGCGQTFVNNPCAPQGVCP